MSRIRLFCTISIFLCALFSAEAQDWEGMAVAYERAVWEGAGPEETNAALLGKAECYKQLGRYGDAVSTLARVSMWALSEGELVRVLYQQELCLFLDGDFAQAAAIVEQLEPGLFSYGSEQAGGSDFGQAGSSGGFGQAAAVVGRLEPSSSDILLLHALVLAYAGRYDESEVMAARYLGLTGAGERLEELLALYREHPGERSETVARVLSFLPPAGHFYNEAYGEGLLSLGLNAAAAAFTAFNLLGGYWISGLVGGAIALDYTFMGNMERNQALVRKYNNNAPLLFGDRLRTFLLEEGKAADAGSKEVEEDTLSADAGSKEVERDTLPADVGATGEELSADAGAKGEELSTDAGTKEVEEDTLSANAGSKGVEKDTLSADAGSKEEE